MAPTIGIPDSPYLTAEECTRYLRFASKRELYRAVKEQGIPARRRGRTLLFRRDELDRWLAGESRVHLLREARRSA